MTKQVNYNVEVGDEIVINSETYSKRKAVVTHVTPTQFKAADVNEYATERRFMRTNGREIVGHGFYSFFVVTKGRNAEKKCFNLYTWDDLEAEKVKEAKQQEGISAKQAIKKFLQTQVGWHPDEEMITKLKAALEILES